MVNRITPHRNSPGRYLPGKLMGDYWFALTTTGQFFTAASPSTLVRMLYATATEPDSPPLRRVVRLWQDTF